MAAAEALVIWLRPDVFEELEAYAVARGERMPTIVADVVTRAFLTEPPGQSPTRRRHLRVVPPSGEPLLEGSDGGA